MRREWLIGNIPMFNTLIFVFSIGHAYYTVELRFREPEVARTVSTIEISESRIQNVCLNVLIRR